MFAPVDHELPRQLGRVAKLRHCESVRHLLDHLLDLIDLAGKPNEVPDTDCFTAAYLQVQQLGVDVELVDCRNRQGLAQSPLDLSA